MHFKDNNRLLVLKRERCLKLHWQAEVNTCHIHIKNRKQKNIQLRFYLSCAALYQQQ